MVGSSLLLCPVDSSSVNASRDTGFPEPWLGVWGGEGQTSHEILHCKSACSASCPLDFLPGLGVSSATAQCCATGVGGAAAPERAQLSQSRLGRWVQLPLGISGLIPCGISGFIPCGISQCSCLPAPSCLALELWSRAGVLKALSLAGILRYRVDFQGMEYQGGDDEFFDLDDY